MSQAAEAITETWRDRLVEVVKMRAGDILPHPHNPKIHPPAQTEPLKGLLSEVGKCDILKAYRSERANGALVYWDGHAREGLNLDEHWQVGIYDISDREADLLVAAYDPLRALAEENKAELDLLLRDVECSNAAVNAMLSQLAESNGLYFGEQKPPVVEDENAAAELVDRAAELQAKWQTALGQIWEIGEHRLGIGDSRNQILVGSLMAGEYADAVVTDSPYGMNVEGVENDDEKGLRGLFDSVLSLLPMKSGVVVNFQGARLFYHWIDAVRAAGHKFQRALWLYKPNDGTFPWRGWLQTGQIILLSTVGEGKWGEGEYKHDTYIENFVGKELEKLIATPKPVNVISHIVDWCSGPGMIVYDPFAGGGSTLVACQEKGRKCRAIDLSPLNAAVILERLSLLSCRVRRVN